MQTIDSHAFSAIEETGKTAEELAKAARASLSHLVGDRRRQSDQVIGAIALLKDRCKHLTGELERARRDNAELVSEYETLQRNFAILSKNQRRLYMGFVTLLKAVEDACGDQVAVDQRIEAALLSSEMGNLLGSQPDITPSNMLDFLNATKSA